ncbi:MerR family transcriptional regulator [Geminicoccus flavidas]|uniref:MerR family transcriptional regulator n=1 Tax=Geminicoccus flavidas TaxID=2506407 RepID=UPI001F433FFC|nr:MerR family transcriptional regulator [Geminicoccus flavidas]
MSETLVGPGSAEDRAVRPTKAASAFRTISEVADELEVAQHVLRFWESKFPQVRPLKRGGGRRYYRPEDIDLLRRIRSLLYDEGYTIKGVQKLLRVRRRTAPATTPAPAGLPAAPEPLAAEPPPDDLRQPPPPLPFDQPPPTPPREAANAERRRLLAELHGELRLLGQIARDLSRQLDPSLLNPSLSSPQDGAIDPPARSVAQPG